MNMPGRLRGIRVFGVDELLRSLLRAAANAHRILCDIGPETIRRGIGPAIPIDAITTWAEPGSGTHISV